ncbi:MAG: YgjP-like metallopeptidase domain-containing protein, partial [Cardiobacterium sp.]
MKPAILDIPHAGQTWRIHCRPPRRNNRRLRLTVEADGNIYLSHPPRSKAEDILRFIHEHLDWLAARARSLETQAARPSPYADGSTHWLLGEPLRLVLRDTAARDIH